MEEKTKKDLKKVDEIQNMNELVAKVLEDSGLKGMENADVTPAGGVKRGDEFALKGIRKVRAKATDTGFLPCTFTTEDGKQVGCKHFASIEGAPEGMPSIGRTATDAATFLVWCRENSIRFEVTNIRSLGDGKYTDDNGNEQTYEKREIRLAVAQ